MGYGLRYEYGMFKQSIEDGWQLERPDHWLRRHDPWELPRPHETVEVKLGCSLELHGGSLLPVAGRPSTLIGVPFDRPVIAYGGKTINSLHLWGAAAHHYFDFQEFSQGDFIDALSESLAAHTLTRVLYPDDSTELGQELRFLQEYFLVACSLADLIRRFRRDNLEWEKLPDKVAIQLNDTHPTLAVPELVHILLDDAHLGWEEVKRPFLVTPSLGSPTGSDRREARRSTRTQSSTAKSSASMNTSGSCSTRCASSKPRTDWVPIGADRDPAPEVNYDTTQYLEQFGGEGPALAQKHNIQAWPRSRQGSSTDGRINDKPYRGRCRVSEQPRRAVSPSGGT
jgi:hypothetical protein